MIIKTKCFWLKAFGYIKMLKIFCLALTECLLDLM